METRLKCKKSPMIIPSSCSCPSCDSLECFSRRYNSDLEKCTCSKCTLINCRYMTKPEPTDQISDHRVTIHDSMNSNTDNHYFNMSKDQSTNSVNFHKTNNNGKIYYNINDDDVSRIDVVVTKNTGYGEIKERVFRGHKERNVVKKSSTTTETNTKLKKSSTSLLRPNAVRGDNKYKKNVSTSTPNTDSCQNKDAEGRSCPKSCAATSFRAHSQQKPLPEISPTNIKSKKSLEQEKHIKEFPSFTTCKVLRDAKTNSQTTVKDSMATFNADLGSKVINEISPCEVCEELLDAIVVSCKSSGRNQEQVIESRKIALRTSSHVIQEQNGLPYFSLREQNKEIEAFPPKAYKIVLKTENYTNDALPRVSSQLISEKNKVSNDFSGERNKNEMESPSQALHAAVPEQIVGTKSVPTKPYQVIRLDNTYNLPVHKSYETVQEPKSDSNDFTVREQMKEHKESTSGTTCEADLDSIKDNKNDVKKTTKLQISDFPIKSYEVVKEENKYANKDTPSLTYESVRDYKTNKPGGNQIKNTRKSSVTEQIKNILEFQSSITCGAVLEQIKDNKNFPTKSYKLVPVNGSNKNVQEILPSTTYHLIEEPKDTLVREEMKNTGEPCSICDVVLSEIKNTGDFPTKSLCKMNVKNKDTSDFAPCTLCESDNVQKKCIIEEKIVIATESTTCITCGKDLEPVKETKKFQSKSNVRAPGENKYAKDFSHRATHDLVSKELKNHDEDIQEHQASATYKSLGRPNENTKDFEPKESCTTCGALIEHIKDTKDFPNKSHKWIKVEDDVTLNFTLCAVCKLANVQNKENVVEQMTTTKNSITGTTGSTVLEEIKETKDFQTKSYKVPRRENKNEKDLSHCTICNYAGKEKKNVQQLLPCAIDKSVQEPKEVVEDVLVRNQVEKTSVSCKTCEVALDEIKYSGAFPADSYKVNKGENSGTSDFTLCAMCESDDVKKKHTVEEKIKNTTGATCCATCGTILEQFRDTEDCQNKSKQDLSHSLICDLAGKDNIENNNFSVGNCSANCSALLEQIKDTRDFPRKSFKVVVNDSELSKVPSSNETTKAVFDKPNTSATNDPPSGTSCNMVVKQKVMFCTKEILPNTTCRTVIEQTVTSSVKDSTADNMDTKIVKHGLQEQIKDIKKLPVDTTPTTFKEQSKDTTAIESSEKCDIFQSSAISKPINVQDQIFQTKCKIQRDNMKKQNINSPKPLTKQDIYNRILEAYKNCSCQVCECIVTLNDASTLKSSESCECTPCECLKYTAPTHRFTTKQSDVRLPALTDNCEDFCNCKPCGCLVCTRQSERECSCKPCECLQCLCISYIKEDKREEFPGEPENCYCSLCQCEECKKNADLGPVVVTHEMSTGPDGIQQQCTCALCSYHFCGHDFSNLENEPCECENQNKFMRKPNAGCVQDYDIRTVSVDVPTIKQNPSHTRNYLHSIDSTKSGSILLDDTNFTKRVCKLKFQTCEKAGKCTQNYHLLETHSAASDSAPNSYSRKVESSISLYTDDSYRGQYKNITDKINITLKDKTILDIEVQEKLRSKTNRKVNVPHKRISSDYGTECTTQSLESIVTETSSGTSKNSSCSDPKEKRKIKSLKHSTSKVSNKNFQIYNIKQYTLKNNSSKLTTSSRNISTGSSKLVQTIIYEICHEILECIVVEVTKDVVMKTELGGKPKSITVLKDAKMKSDEVDFSVTSLKLDPTDNKSVVYTKTEENSSNYENQDDFANKNALQESKSSLFNTSSTKKQTKGGYQDCNFCIVDESFGNILNCKKYTNDDRKCKGRPPKNSISPEHLRYPNVLRAFKISRPDFPLKYSWINTSELDNLQISITDRNNFEYYNNLFELQVYNIRLENTLKKAKTFSMELMKILHKFEKANKNFKSLSKNVHPIPSELQEDGHDNGSISRKEKHYKNIIPQENRKRCSSPLRKFKTCFKCDNINKALRLEEENTLKVRQQTDVDQVRSTCENSYSESILYDESLDKGLNSPHTMNRRDSKAKISTNTGPDSERRSFTVGFKDGITLRDDKLTDAFKETNDQDVIKDYRPYNLIENPQQQMHARKWSNMRKNFYTNDAKLTAKSVGVSVRPISTVGTPHDDMKSAVVQTNQWDDNTYNKTTYENRALAKLKMEVTQLSNMPFLQPHIWSNSYDEGTSDSKSDLDDFTSLPPKQRVMYKENMWDTLLQDIDYSYTLPPKRKIVREMLKGFG